MIQYRHSLLALPPPNPPPPPTSVLKDNIPPSSLVCGYDSEPEPEEDEVPAETIEADPEFIGPRVPRAESDPPPPGAEDLKQDEYKTSSETYTASQNNLENENSKGILLFTIQKAIFWTSFFKSFLLLQHFNIKLNKKLIDAFFSGLHRLI